MSGSNIEDACSVPHFQPSPLTMAKSSGVPAYGGLAKKAPLASTRTFFDSADYALELEQGHWHQCGRNSPGASNVNTLHWTALVSQSVKCTIAANLAGCSSKSVGTMPLHRGTIRNSRLSSASNQ